MITFEGVTKQYPDGTVAVDELSLDVEGVGAIPLNNYQGIRWTTSLGYVDPAGDEAVGYAADEDYLQHIEEQDRSPGRWRRSR